MHAFKLEQNKDKSPTFVLLACVYSCNSSSQILHLYSKATAILVCEMKICKLLQLSLLHPALPYTHGANAKPVEEQVLLNCGWGADMWSQLSHALAQVSWARRGAGTLTPSLLLSLGAVRPYKTTLSSIHRASCSPGPAEAGCQGWGARWKAGGLRWPKSLSGDSCWADPLMSTGRRLQEGCTRWHSITHPRRSGTCLGLIPAAAGCCDHFCAHPAAVHTRGVAKRDGDMAAMPEPCGLIAPHSLGCAAAQPRCPGEGRRAAWAERKCSSARPWAVVLVHSSKNMLLPVKQLYFWRKKEPGGTDWLKNSHWYISSLCATVTCTLPRCSSAVWLYHVNFLLM